MQRCGLQASDHHHQRVLYMRALQIGTFEASLGLIAIGILLVDGNANIIHDSSILAKHFSWKFRDGE